MKPFLPTQERRENATPSSSDDLLETAAHQLGSSPDPIYIYDDLEWSRHTSQQELDLSDLSHFPSRSTVAKSTKAAAIYLSALMVAHIKVINARDFSHSSPLGTLIRHHLAADYTTQLDNLGQFMRFDECNEIWKAIVKASPEVWFEVHEVRADVSYPNGVATVFMHQRVHGWPESPGSVIKALIQASWRLRKSGEWEIYRVQAMRGGGLYEIPL